MTIYVVETRRKTGEWKPLNYVRFSDRVVDLQQRLSTYRAQFRGTRKGPSSARIVPYARVSDSDLSEGTKA